MLRIGPLKALGNRFLSVLIAMPLLLPVACAQKEDEATAVWQMNAVRKAIEQQQKPTPVRDEDRPLAVVESLPEDETVEGLQAKLPELFIAIGSMPQSERPGVYEALALLRNQPNIVDAIVSYYRALATKAISDRLLSLQVLGELQRPDAQAFFEEVIWRPLPEPDGLPNIGERISAREYEEMMQWTAVQGIAYLRAPDGIPLPEAIEETLRVVKEHSSQAVKIAAIDAYMWNNGDAVASELYDELPEELHKFVERPRFHRGANKNVFESRLERWRERWER